MRLQPSDTGLVTGRRRGIELVNPSVAAGGVVYVRTAFVENGGGTGTLNDPNDPYGLPSTALAALAGAYAGQTATVYFKDSLTVEDITLTDYNLGVVTFKGFGAIRAWNFAGLAASGADETGAPGRAMVFDAITSTGAVNASGGQGTNGETPGGTGGAGGNAGSPIVLLNGSVIAVITASGGAGGTGGAGDGGTAGGNGGPGGSGATINHDGTSSATAHSQSGGAGGTAGSDGGAGPGNEGAAGSNGSYNLI